MMKQRLSFMTTSSSSSASTINSNAKRNSITEKSPMPEPMASSSAASSANSSLSGMPMPEGLGASSASGNNSASSSGMRVRGSVLGSNLSPKTSFTLKSPHGSMTDMLGSMSVSGSALGGAINEKLIILRAGFLKKKGVINTGWKKRWFLLTDKQLAYYDEEPEDLDIEEPKGFISLALITKVGHHSDKSSEDFMFDVITPARVYRLQAESISEMEAWIATISGTAANAQQHSRRRGTQGIVRDMTEDTALQGEDISAAFGGPHQPADLRKWELWNAYDVSAWLQTFGMGKHRKKFYAAGITGAHLKGLSSESLAQLGVTEKTEQIKILSSVQRLISGSA